MDEKEEAQKPQEGSEPKAKEETQEEKGNSKKDEQSPLQQAEEINKKKEELLEKEEKLTERKEKLEATRLIGGESQAGSTTVKEKTKEEIAKAYVKDNFENLR